MILEHFPNTFSLSAEKLAELARGRETLHLKNRAMKGGHFTEKQIVSLTSGDIWNRTTKLPTENRLMMKWGKRCDSKQNVSCFWEDSLRWWAWPDAVGKNCQEIHCSLCSLTLFFFFFVFPCHLGHWTKRSLLTLPHAKEDTCRTVKYRFQARCALCACHQWQQIYLYPEKERTIILYLIYC